ncbi:MAG TPA: UTP--glucose-1-phosphate uridylyltransferase, partial [Ramlibacter sp.]|nr:UTP--glucose-1-phosphate uridylyltransferase [Ramlibacter sp.]
LVRAMQPDDMDCSYVRQPRSLGLGHAVLCAQPLVGDEPFAVLLADDLMTGLDGGPSVLTQMVEVFQEVATSLLAVQEVPLDAVRRYGVVAGEAAGERIVKVRQMVEKPEPRSAPSRMAVAGRYILTPAVFDHIRSNGRGAGGEIQLTDGIAKLVDTEGVHAYQYIGKRYDCGSKEGFLEATVELALKHPEVGSGFKEYLKGLTLRP